MLRDPVHGHLRFSQAEVDAVCLVQTIETERALVVSGGGPSGGFVLPFSLDPSIILTSEGSQNPIRRLARIVNPSGREWHGVSSEGVSASFAAELEEVGDDTPTLAGPVVYTEKAHAFIPASFEVTQDWAGLQGELGRLFADAKDRLESQKFWDGAGTASNEPEGLITGLGTAERVYTSGTGAFGVGDTYLLKEALPSRWVPNSTLAWHPTTADRAWRFVGGGSTGPR